MDDAALRYSNIVEAVDEQRRRLGLEGFGVDRWSALARRFRSDPRREPDGTLNAILDYIRPEHTLLDIGGGAGRYGLPLALHCRSLVNVEPSPGMGRAFLESAAEAGISNVKWISSDWIGTEKLKTDVSLVVHVTYFVQDIIPFLEKLRWASGERVIIAMSITPPPNQGANLFPFLYQETQALVPGYRELLPVLWEIGIVPDVHVLDNEETTSLGGVFSSRQEAIAEAVAALPADSAAASRTRKRWMPTSRSYSFKWTADGVAARAAIHAYSSLLGRNGRTSLGLA